LCSDIHLRSGVSEFVPGDGDKRLIEHVIGRLVSVAFRNVAGKATETLRTCRGVGEVEDAMSVSEMKMYRVLLKSDKIFVCSYTNELGTGC
jgi:hypothetical protein